MEKPSLVDSINEEYEAALDIIARTVAMTDKIQRANQAIDVNDVIRKFVKNSSNVMQTLRSEGQDTTDLEAKCFEVVKLNNDMINIALMFTGDDLRSGGN
jgi:hypothetical protein